jgi:hypothetical protein
MRKLTLSSPQAGVVILLLVASTAFAESRLDQVWTCTLTEGHTVAEATTAQAAWVAWANKQPHGANIRGYVATPTVASDLSVVLYIDSYPDLDTYAADAKAYDSPEGRALQARFDELTSCSAAALYSVDDGKK